MQKLSGSNLHENIVNLYETYEDHWSFHLVMEWCKGGELLPYITSIKFFSEARAAMIFRQMAAAVEHCHRSGICHRDLKPENFLLAEQATAKGDVHVKLCDFGIAAILPDKDDETKDDMDELAGTCYYMAPEVADENNLNAYTRRCDCWSLGVILYLIISGRHPFGDGLGSEEVKDLVINGDLEVRDEALPPSPGFLPGAALRLAPAPLTPLAPRAVSSRIVRRRVRAAQRGS